MKLQIPSLGDKFELKKDWTFTLHAEYRNSKVLDYAGFIGTRWGYLKKEDYIEYPVFPKCPIDRLDKKYYTIFNRFNVKKYDEDLGIWMKTSKEYQEWNIKNKEVSDKAKETISKTIESTSMTIPKGCILTVDRIYIRKNAKAYDSVSFWVEGLIPNKKVRFWVSLNDANNIEYK